MVNCSLHCFIKACTVACSTHILKNVSVPVYFGYFGCLLFVVTNTINHRALRAIQMRDRAHGRDHWHPATSHLQDNRYVRQDEVTM
jgi:hypothetical protein